MIIVRLAEKVVREINALAKKPHRASHLYGPNYCIQVGLTIGDNPLHVVEDAVHVFSLLGEEDPEECAELLVEWATQRITAREEMRRENKRTRTERRASNRGLYQPAPIIRYYEYKDKTTKEVVGTRWHGDMDLRSAGLLPSAVIHRHGEQAVPMNMSLLNALPADDGGRRKKIPEEVWDTLNNHGIAVSGERLGINMNTPAWQWALKMFPNAKDMSGYVHSLFAPMLPHGYSSNIRVKFSKLCHPDGRDLKTDGSGWYHPDTPELQLFIKKYGLVPIQIRFVTKTNVFAKGMLFPTEYSVDDHNNPCVTFDWLQVKGVHKNVAKKFRADGIDRFDVGFLGIIQNWTRPGVLRACFELPENLKVNAETTTIAKLAVDRSFTKLRKGGIDKLVSELARDDEQIDLMAQMVTIMKMHGADIEATQIPRIREAAKDKLGRRVYQIATAAGIEFPRYVCRLDNTLEPGTCVVTGIPAGRTVVGFRFPMVLAQGMMTLTVVDTPEHLQCRKEDIPFTVTMHPDDLTTRMQGDDDGDIAGISDNPEMVRLWSHVDDDRIFHIEPEGEGIFIPSDSPEGLKYLQKDQRGPVGTNTRHRSRLKAVGAHMEAIGMSISIQEAIDKAKNIINWSDYRRAGEFAAWEEHEDGYHFNIRTGVSDDFDGKECWKYVTQILQERGGIDMTQALGWAWPNKKIDFETWVTTTARTGWDGGNLVHYIHNYAHAQFQEFAHEFRFNDALVEAEHLLPRLLTQLGHVVEMPDMNFEDYRATLRETCGLNSFGEQMQRAMTYRGSPGDEEDNSLMMKAEKQRLIDDATHNLNSKLKTLTLQELVNIWVMECQSDKLTNAFRVICWPGSPVLTLMEITEPEYCDYLNDPVFTNDGLVARDQVMLQTCLDSENPYETISHLIYHDQEHHTEVFTEDGEPVPLHACHHCRTTAEDMVVRAMRRQQANKEAKYFSYLIPRLNGTHRGR